MMLCNDAMMQSQSGSPASIESNGLVAARLFFVLLSLSLAVRYMDVSPDARLLASSYPGSTQ